MPSPFAATPPTFMQRLQPWQPSGQNLSLNDFDAGAKPFSLGDKARDKAAVEELAVELDALQNLFYADKRYKLLVVLQGTDTSGKDGTIRGVFGRMSALGVHAVGWKAPTETERAHDAVVEQRPAHEQVVVAGGHDGRGRQPRGRGGLQARAAEQRRDDPQQEDQDGHDRDDGSQPAQRDERARESLGDLDRARRRAAPAPSGDGLVRHRSLAGARPRPRRGRRRRHRAADAAGGRSGVRAGLRCPRRFRRTRARCWQPPPPAGGSRP